MWTTPNMTQGPNGVLAEATMFSSSNEDPSETVFVPRSIVLTRGPVAFDSDDDDDETRPTTSHGSTIRPVDDATKWSRLVYSDDGFLTSVHLGAASVPRSLVGLLPTDAWDTLLDEEDRRRLARFLPPLDETQQSEVVRALLSGENFFFGNPLIVLDEMIQSGRCTEEAMCDLVKRTKLGVEASRQHCRERIRRQLKAIWKDGKEEILEHPDLRDNKDRAQIESLREEKQSQVLMSPYQTQLNSTSVPTSLFQAIKHVLETTSSSDEEIVDHLRNDYRYLFSSIPPSFSIEQYIKSAVGCLRLGQAESSRRFETPFIETEPSGKYRWLSGKDSIERENDRLLVLEAFFTDVVAGKRTSPIGVAGKNEHESTENSSETNQPKRKKMRMTGSKTDRAHQQVAMKSHTLAPTEKATRFYSSRILKNSLCPLHPTSRLLEGVDEHRRLEIERYKHHTQNFLVTVGPALKEPEKRLDSAQLLVSDAPSAATMLSLVYDACARLPEGVGTRADIGILVSASRFVRADAPISLLSMAIAHRMSILEAMPLGESGKPCIKFDVRRGVWEYRHTLMAWSISEPETEAPTNATPKKLSIQNLLH